MSLSEGFSEDDLINITFEVCDAQQKGAVPATVFIKYLEDVTGHSHDHNKVLLLYNLLDPKKRNVPVTRETFHATMKKWIAICNQDCISETEAVKGRTETIGNQQHKDTESFIADEDAEIFERRTEYFQICISRIEDLKYMNQKMTEQLLGVKKMMVSEETYLQLADEIAELRDRLISMQKPLGKFKCICTELEEIKNKMAHSHEENHQICEFIRSLNKSIISLTTKLISLEENVKANEERCTSGSEALFLSMWECFLNLFQEIKSQQENIFQMLREEMMLANLCPSIKAWNKVLLKLEMLLESLQHLAKSSRLDTEHSEKQQMDETQEYMEQSSLEEEMQPSSNYMGQECLRHEDNHKKKADDIYPVQKEGILAMKNKMSSKESTACSKSSLLLPTSFPFLTSRATGFLDNDDSKVPTSLIDALNLEHNSTQKRCWTFPNLFLLGQRWGFKENLLNSKTACRTEYGQNIKRTFNVNTQNSNENGVNHLHLPRYSAVTQWSWDHKTPQYLSSEVTLKQTFPSVLDLFSLHCNPTCPSSPIMPTPPEEVRQPTETQHAILPSLAKESSDDAATCNTPSIILPEYAVRPDIERETNVAFRSVSSHLQHSNRNARKSTSSLTSVDHEGHIIDLLNDQLPDIQISDEDKKKNIELLEEAKKVSERFLRRRGRKSRSSLSDSPTALSPTLSPTVSPATSRNNSLTLPSATDSDICTSTVESVFPLQNPTNGISNQKENDQRKVSQERLVPHITGLESPKEKLSEQKENFDPHKLMDNLSRFCSSDTDTGRGSPNSSRNICENELGKEFRKKIKGNDSPFKGHLHGPGIITLGTKLKDSAPRLKGSKVSCKTELNTSGSRPPLLRAASWDQPESDNIEKALSKPSENNKNCDISNQSGKIPIKQPPFKDFQIQVQPVRMQKLTKLREEHILMRNQNLIGLKLPDLSEAAEQERGFSPIPFSVEEEEESKNKCDVMPNIPDTLLRKLRVHTPLTGSSLPLTEREVENAFVQLSLAFRNDSYTLESRINQAERERNLAEENTEKELDNFKGAITSSACLWHHSEHRDMYQKLLEDISVLHRLAARLSSRAEMVGAVRQEKRMSKATEVMMQYVENLKRTYEKDHAELIEYKKLANQNSSRSYGSPEDGVPRTSRSMSLSAGKMPRRRVSVAVVSKFELPGQSPGQSPIPLAPSSLSESSNGRSSLTSTPLLPAVIENGRPNGDSDCEQPPSASPQSGLEEISPGAKAKIEEEAYNKGYQEGLRKTKETEELKEDNEEKIHETPKDFAAVETDGDISKQQSKLEVVIHYVQILYPKLHKHWNMLWMVAAVITIFAIVLGTSSLYNYFSCTELSDGPQVKAACSAAQRYSWWSSGLQHGQRTE